MQSALCFASQTHHLLSTPAICHSGSHPKPPATISSRHSPIKATAVVYETSFVDYSSVISVFPAEACETIGEDACLADVYPEAKIKPEVKATTSPSPTELIEREYMDYTNNLKTVLPGDAWDVLGGEFCECPYQRGVY